MLSNRTIASDNESLGVAHDKKLQNSIPYFLGHNNDNNNKASAITNNEVNQS